MGGIEVFCVDEGLLTLSHGEIAVVMTMSIY